MFSLIPLMSAVLIGCRSEASVPQEDAVAYETGAWQCMPHPLSPRAHLEEVTVDFQDGRYSFQADLRADDDAALVWHVSGEGAYRIADGQVCLSSRMLTVTPGDEATRRSDSPLVEETRATMDTVRCQPLIALSPERLIYGDLTARPPVLMECSR